MKWSICRATNGIDAAATATDGANARLHHFNEILIVPKSNHAKPCRRLSFRVEILIPSAHRTDLWISVITSEVLERQGMVNRRSIGKYYYLSLCFFTTAFLYFGFAVS